MGGHYQSEQRIVHGGFHEEPGTLKAKYCLPPGNQMYPKMCEELDVTFKQNGILLVARNDKEMETVMMYYKRGKDRGVNLRLVNKEELHEMEPNLSESIVGALYAPEGGSIMPFELAAALMENAIQNGGLGCSWKIRSLTAGLKERRNT